MLSMEEVGRAMNRGRAAFETLETLYRRLPATRCDCATPGICCRFMPEMTLLEALHWVTVLAGMPVDRREETLRRFLFFYLVTPLRQPGCPFLDAGGGCGIYLQRPFACRAYGLWGHRAGQVRTRQNREAARALIRGWRQLGIRIPEDGVNYEMDYCRRVLCRSSAPPTDRQLMELLLEVYALNSGIGEWQAQFENACHSDFSYWLTAVLWGPRKAVLAKMAVVKEIAETGAESRLHKLVARSGVGVLARQLGRL